MVLRFRYQFLGKNSLPSTRQYLNQFARFISFQHLLAVLQQYRNAIIHWYLIAANKITSPTERSFLCLPHRLGRIRSAFYLLLPQPTVCGNSALAENRSSSLAFIERSIERPVKWFRKHAYNKQSIRNQPTNQRQLPRDKSDESSFHCPYHVRESVRLSALQRSTGRPTDALSVGSCLLPLIFCAPLSLRQSHSVSFAQPDGDDLRTLALAAMTEILYLHNIPHFISLVLYVCCVKSLLVSSF